ncbi:MAG: methyltransferase domain-containing protein [Terriglobales bacterium]
MTNRATQAELLEQRIRENRASQEVDLAAWIFERVRVEPTDQVLELCSGTGGQTLRMLSSLGKRGRLVALDLSAAALATLTGKLSGADSGKLTTVEASLDELSQALERSGFRRPCFDLVFCAYGLYYSQDPKKTLDEILAWLKPGGRIVVAGPYGPNNKPLFDLIEASGVTLGDAVTFSSQFFMVETVIPWAALRFESVRVSTMVNPIRWAMPESVLNYWQNTTFYDSARQPAFEALLQRHFAEHGQFVNEKWVMMVEMRDARP